MEHREIFAFDSDPKYLIIETKEKSIFNIDYYLDKNGVYGETLDTEFNPKSLIYVMQYYSKTDNAYRHLILMPASISKPEVVGYKYKESLIWKYMEQNKEKIIEKKAFIYPILLYTIEKIGMKVFDKIILK
jgi:hypothetical protein